MKKVLSLLVVGGMLAVAACGPSEAEKKAAEQRKLDSIASFEKAKLDSMAAVANDAAARAAAAEAEVKDAKADLKDAKADAKQAKADADAAEEAKKKADEEAKKANEKPANLGKKGDVNKAGETGTPASPLKKKGS